jgi:titin
MGVGKQFGRLSGAGLFPLLLLLSLGIAHTSNTPNGGSILHSFTGSPGDGSNPVGSPVQDTAGFLYGMTPSGGSGGCGVIFKTGKDGSNYTILHSFVDGRTPNDGANPNGNLLLSGSTLYGMTSAGGVANNGTIFKINTDGSKYTILYEFGAGTTANDGANPNGSLVMSGSTLYGMNFNGGSANGGTIFKINTDGTGYAILRSFCNGSAASDGCHPTGSLVLSGSTLYGMTQQGGCGWNSGTIFKINTGGTGYAVLHRFNDGTIANDGATPDGSLVVYDSNLYGLTRWNGQFDGGTIFKLKTDGTGYAVLHSFGDRPYDAWSPRGSLVVSGSTLYGMTIDKVGSHQGTIFQINADGTGYTVLHDFGDGTIGYQPQGDLIVSGSTLYGMANLGGSYGMGTVFSFSILLPGAPTGVSAAAGDSQATIGFTPPASSGGSEIIYYTVTSSPGGITQTGQAGPITVAGLTDGTPYSFTVTATNVAGTGPASSPSNTVTPSSQSKAPGAPTSVAATAGDAKATVSFTPPLSSGSSPITSYTVTSNPDGITQSGSASPITVTGLTNGQPYTFTVTAKNSVGPSPASSYSNSVTPTGVPDAPTNVSATAGNARATVNFSPPASSGGSNIASYTVTSSPGGITQSGPGNQITITGLTNGTTYTFTVAATNSAGLTGPASSPSNSVTPMTVPGPPTGVGATAGEQQATIVFTPPVSNGGSPITSYTAVSSPGGITRNGDASPMIVTGLANGTAYTFTVTATNAVGAGTASSPSNSVVPGSLPNGLLHNFTGAPGDGAHPNSSLVQDAKSFYGMTPSGGVSNSGVIFRIDKDGSNYTILHSFSDGRTSNDGAAPNGNLLLSSTTLFGMTSAGGIAGRGTIFKINTDGTGYSILYAFGEIGGNSDGNQPDGSLILSGSTLYGMTYSGGTPNAGTIFKINTDGTGYALLCSFNSGSVANDGCNPNGSLVLSGSTLYGMTLSNFSGQNVQNFGTIFKINTDGTGYAILHRFNDGTVPFDGYSPNGSLLLSGSTLYGVTYSGGVSDFNAGAIFKIGANGAGYTILHSFRDETVTNDGANPYGSLTLSGAVLYGMTHAGGSANAGTVFQINSDGTGCRILHSFNDGTIQADGYKPYGDLILSESKLYGMTGSGGAYGLGSIFSLALTSVPGAPTGVSAAAEDAQATVAFTPPHSNGGSDILYYTVTSSPGGITQTGWTSPIAVGGLANGTGYTFSVTATNAFGTGPASTASNKVTPAAHLTAPGAPTGPAGTAGNAQATVAFTPPLYTGGSPIISYTVTSNPGSITQSGAASPITVTGLTNGTAYTFTVKASNAVGTGPASVSSNSVTPAAIPDAPTSVSATAGNARATVNFSPPASSGGSNITSYTVTSSPGGITQEGSGNQITITGLTNGTAYTFAVTAKNSAGTGPASAPSNSVTPMTVPGQPTGVGATAGERQATVFFSPPVSNGGSLITSYAVTSSPGGITQSGLNSPIVVTGLTNGTPYTFTVTAANAVGAGPASSPSNSVVPGSLPNGLLHNFTGPLGDGANPYSSLVQDADSFYGMTSSGGISNAGVIFKTKKDGSDYTILHSFIDGKTADDGANPSGNLLLSGSTLYGMTGAGGINGKGTVFKINTDGSNYTVLYRFGAGSTANDGCNPNGSLVMSGSTIYGMTYGGGKSNAGTIFKINTDGTGYAILRSFSDGSMANDGCNPNGTLVLSGSTLFGMTKFGGIIDPQNSNNSWGTVFKINTQGTGYAILHRFNDGMAPYDGYSPNGSLVLSGSSLYGMTWSGGVSRGGAGTIFKIGANGAGYTILHSFGDGSVTNDGTNPYGSLMLSGAVLYGMTYSGGSANGGTVFRINTDGTGCRTLHAFNDGTIQSDGYNPYGDLIVSGPALYGMTFRGGKYGFGTIFSLALPSAPGAPTGVSAAAEDAQATVAFTPPHSNGGSDILYYTATSSPGGIAQTGYTSPIAVSGLTNGTAYIFTVTATNSVGTGPASTPSNSVTPVSHLTAPAAPTGPAATAWDAQATISFTPPLSNGGSPIAFYTVTSNPGAITQSGPVSPITVTGLTNGTAYTFTVKASNGLGPGPPSVSSNSVTPLAIPGTPTSVSASAGNGQATVNFSPPASSGGSNITSYTVTSSPGGITQEGSGNQITITGLANGTAYTFTVTAKNSAGTGPASAPSNSVTPTTVPGAPTGVGATAGEQQATVVFTPPASNGGSIITSYTVTSNPGGITQSGLNSPIVVTGLTNSTPYTFTVTATNAAGPGPASAPSNSVVPGSLPIGLLHNFSGYPGDGSNPHSSLVQDADSFYGMTPSGGTGNSGAIFKISKTGGNFKILHFFADGSIANDGATPNGSLLLDGSVLYGMTSTGGVNGRGTIFTIDTNGGNYAILYSFGAIDSSNDGNRPNGSLVLSGSTFYGMTYYGGTTSWYEGGYGTIFKINLDGSGYAILHNFSDGATANDGANPQGSLVLSGSTLLGMTSSGGINSNGTIFGINTNGTGYTILHRFNDGTTPLDGYSPNGSLVLSGSTLYGMTYNGGLSNAPAGTVFKIGTNGGGYSLLHSFGDGSAANDGLYPDGSLIVSSGVLYGMTYYGGPYSGWYGNSYGTVFKINTDGTGCRVLHAFNDGTTTPDGYNPYGDLILSGSTLYGMTSSGGANGLGAIFALALPSVPGAPTGVSATAGNAQATVAFTPPVSNGGSDILYYIVTSNPQGITQTGYTSPITVSGLTNGTAYTFTVTATNMQGTGPASGPSGSVTPAL